jgi:vacuolar protein sorting-associated protein VTA1
LIFYDFFIAPSVAYWARVYSLQLGIKSAKQPDEKGFLLTLMDWLEKIKKTHKDNDSITNDTVAQAYLENYAHKLFTYADQQDRASNFGKNVVKAFYTSAMVS